MKALGVGEERVSSGESSGLFASLPARCECAVEWHRWPRCRLFHDLRGSRLWFGDGGGVMESLGGVWWWFLDLDLGLFFDLDLDIYLGFEERIDKFVRKTVPTNKRANHFSPGEDSPNFTPGEYMYRPRCAGKTQF